MSISKKRVVSTLLTAASTLVLTGMVMIAPMSALAYDFTRGLTVGSTGSDVVALQQYLNGAGFQVSASGAGSPGSESTYFGSKTKAAVAKWQAANGVAPAVGYFGSISKAKYVSLTGGSTSTTFPAGCTSTVGYSSTTGLKCDGGTSTVVGKGVTVAAGIQPANSLAVNNATRLPFTVIKFTASTDGDVTIDSVVVERTGLANDAAFSGVVLLDENGSQVGIAKSLNSSHQATLTEDFVVKAGQTRTMTIGANRGSTAAYAGQVASFSLVSVAANATVNGTLPIVGSSHTINESLSMGTITMARGSIDPGSSVSKEVGTTGYTFSSVKVTAGSAEDVILKGVRFNQTGSAGSGDFANLKIYVNGTAYDVTVSSDGKYFSANFGTGVKILKGFSADISIKGDIVGGSARMIDFDIAKRTDIEVVGALYGYGITPPQTGSSALTNSSNSSAFSSAEDPWYSASEVTISAGTMNVSGSTLVPAQNIATNLANQSLGAFSVDVKGEAISVGRMIFSVASTTGSGYGLLTSVSLYDENGKVVSGPVDGEYTGALTQTLTFTDSVIFSSGAHTYYLKGKVASTIGNNGTYIVSFTPSTAFTTVIGQTTNTTITPAPASSIGLSTMTVKGGSLTVNVSTLPVAQNVVAGATQYTFANYIFDASQSGEDVKITSIPLYYDTNGTRTDLTNCQLYDGSSPVTTGSNVKNPATTDTASSTSMTFDGSGLTISKGTSKTLALKCNVKTGVTTKYWWGIDDAQNANFTGATGLSSGQTIAESFTDANGQVMTAVAGGSYTVAADSSSSYGYKIVKAGSTGVSLAAFKFTAGASEDVILKQIALQLGNTASNSPADLAEQKVTLWDGSTEIGSAQFGLTSADNATSTLYSTVTVTITKGETKTIVVKGNLSAQDSVNGTPGAFVAITYDGNNNHSSSNSSAGNYATGKDSGSTIGGGTTSDVTTNGVRIFRNVPTIAVTSSGGTLSPNNDLYKFTVTNPDSRDMVLKKLTFSVATTGGASTGFTLYGDGVAANGSVAEAPLGTLTITFDATSEAKRVPGSSSKTYSVRVASIVDTASVSETLSIGLKADTSYPSLAGLMGKVTDLSASNIIWSPGSTTTVDTTAVFEGNSDWTNGYGVSGFPSVGGDFSSQTWTRAN